MIFELSSARTLQKYLLINQAINIILERGPRILIDSALYFINSLLSCRLCDLIVFQKQSFFWKIFAIFTANVSAHFCILKFLTDAQNKFKYWIRCKLTLAYCNLVSALFQLRSYTRQISVRELKRRENKKKKWLTQIHRRRLLPREARVPGPSRREPLV